ncbi:MAG: CDP-archaeol synthase [Lentisphaerota bacterium]
MIPKLNQRVTSGVIIGAAFLCALFWAPHWVAWLILSVLCALSSLEFYAMLDAAHIPNFRIMGTLGGLLLIAATSYQLTQSPGSAFHIESAVIFLLTAGVFLRQFPQKNNTQPLETIGGTLLGFLYTAFLLNFIGKILFTWGNLEGRLLILYFVSVVKFTDIGAFFVGCSFGKHKLIPRISPAKTWEGLFGGVASGVLVSLLFLAATRGSLGGIHMTLRDACVLGILLPLCGVLGDLTESLFKRAAGVKDSGQLIRGMGGLLDVLDSLLFAAPVVYIYGSLFWS